MADNVTNISAQVEYKERNQMRVTDIFVNVEYQEKNQARLSKLMVMIEYTGTPIYVNNMVFGPALWVM